VEEQGLVGQLPVARSMVTRTTLRRKFIDQVGTSYPFAEGAILNIDSSEVVKEGDPPCGAHSHIFHKELAWIVASAAN